MKKIYFLILLLAVSAFVTAQTIENPLHAVKHEINNPVIQNSGSKIPTDTILMNDFLNFGQATLYSNIGGGYVFGTNVIDTTSMTGLSVDAQGFMISPFTSYGIEEVLIWVGALQQISLNGSYLIFKVQKIDATSSYTLGGTPYSIQCPGTVLASDTVQFSEIDTTSGNVTIATFGTPVYINNFDYSIACYLTNFYTNHDTIGFVSSADGGGTALEGIEYTWLKYGTKWYQASHVYSGLDLAIAFWPVVDVNYIGINDIHFSDGMKLSCNPNPVTADALIQYVLENDANAELEIYNVKGQKVLDFNEGHQAAGLHSISVCADDLSNGTYYCSLKTDKGRLTKKMIVAR